MSSNPTSSTEQRIKRAQKRPNKSQVRAAQARSEQAAAAPAPKVTESAIVPAAQTQSLTPAQRRALERGGVARGSGLPVGVAPLTRAEEMTMIREDLRRLLIIAGVLLVGMLSLLFVLD
ncbi:MAG: hypothetical protein R2845_16160 [Thermomicrobiales bacterium]